MRAEVIKQGNDRETRSRVNERGSEWKGGQRE